MTNKIATLTLAAVAGLIAPAVASATTIGGRITAFSPTSITVLDKEAVTVGLNNDTVFTKLVEQKAWQQDTAFSADRVRVGGYAVVHVPDNGGFVANWVQVSMNGAPFAYSPVTPSTIVYNGEALKHLADAADHRAHPTAAESKRPGAPGTAAHCERIANEAATLEPAPKGAPYNNRLQKLGK